MKKVLLYSMLLVAGLVLSQILPGMLGEVADTYGTGVRWLTLIALAFIMIHVGYEFDIDKSNVRQYGWDYVVAATAAAFPWIFVAIYFVFVLLPSDHWGSWYAWKENLLASRFAAPTSAGVLFSMLAAAGLAGTWLFRKARILAIFDDLDTVLLMIPLKMMMVGVRWQLAVIVLIMAVQIWIAWKYLHTWKLSLRWPAVLIYSVVIVGICESIHAGSLLIDAKVPIHLEVLLPAFVLGCLIRRPGGGEANVHDDVLGHDSPGERLASTIVSAAFMLLVGLSMPAVLGASAPAAGTDAATVAATTAATTTASEGYAFLSTHTPEMGWGTIAMHVLIVTVISNLGKMFPALCYRREAPLKTRLALAIGMWPRGEVGAGVLVVSLSYGIGGPIVTIAMLSLALNLLCTGLFIVVIKKLLGAELNSPGPAPTAH
ncbi:MAG: sodium:proton antiporter [Planctomycetota bacterium]|nr:sodium:proton antiporter [Planctomycetota bacterium]